MTEALIKRCAQAAWEADLHEPQAWVAAESNRYEILAAAVLRCAGVIDSPLGQGVDQASPAKEAARVTRSVGSVRKTFSPA
jgi:hypothetical protein